MSLRLAGLARQQQQPAQATRAGQVTDSVCLRDQRARGGGGGGVSASIYPELGICRLTARSRHTTCDAGQDPAGDPCNKEKHARTAGDHDHACSI
jgi:hypothetical protein